MLRLTTLSAKVLLLASRCPPELAAIRVVPPSAMEELKTVPAALSRPPLPTTICVSVLYSTVALRVTASPAAKVSGAVVGQRKRPAVGGLRTDRHGDVGSHGHSRWRPWLIVKLPGKM